jgi:ubiquinone/menaquinone biosynthesis C-methylase UbiE
VESERISRERVFHNQRYSDDSEREGRLGKFYATLSYGFQTYWTRIVAESSGHSVLEYGCGTGGLALQLAEHSPRVIGIDISDVAIDIARQTAASRNLGNLEYRVEDAEALKLPDRHVDVVVGIGIVHHLHIRKAMSEVRRVLSDRGIALFAEPMGHNPVLNWYRNRTPGLRSPDEHPLVVDDLRFMAGLFSSIKVTYFGLITPLLGLMSNKPASEGSRLTRFVWWLDKRLCSVPGLGRLAWYCLVELRV